MLLVSELALVLLISGVKVFAIAQSIGAYLGRGRACATLRQRLIIRVRDKHYLDLLDVPLKSLSH